MNLDATLAALAGGGLIGLAASILLVMNGRIAGISGIFSGLLQPREGEFGWRAAFIAGLMLGGLTLGLAEPTWVAASDARGLWATGLGGALVGFGVRRGSGCTSGHGVCGLSRGSRRSFAATVTFIGTGMVVATGISLVFGGAL